MSRPPAWMGAVVLLVGACSSPLGSSPAGSAGTGSTGTAGTSAGGTTGSSGAGGGNQTPPDCKQPQASAVPLTALTESQFNNTVLDVFQVAGEPAKGLGQ